MNFPKITFTKRETPKIEVVQLLIEASKKSIKDIENRIAYLEALQENMDKVNKAQAQYQLIIDFLIKKTTNETRDQEELNKVMGIK